MSVLAPLVMIKALPTFPVVGSGGQFVIYFFISTAKSIQLCYASHFVVVVVVVSGIDVVNN